MKRSLAFACSLLLALAVSAFALKKPAPTKPNTVLYWYTVTYDAGHPSGYITGSSSFYVQDDKANISSPCPAGSSKDCLRGFTSQLTSFPNTTVGSDQIKKP